jgi:hypothetical protein
MLLLGINLSLMQWAGFALTLLAVWVQQAGQITPRASSQPSYPNVLANKNRKEIRS